jgi:hypothetical protein
MMRLSARALALLACLAVAACGISTRSPPKLAPDSTVLGQCQRVAQDDPTVKSLIIEGMSVTANPPHDEALRLARLDATNACLKARGVPVPGGVEPVHKSGYLF